MFQRSVVEETRVYPAVEKKHIVDALTQILLPTQSRTEDGNVLVVIEGSEIADKQLAQWESQFTDLVGIPVDINTTEIEDNGAVTDDEEDAETDYNVTVTVSLDPDTCRLGENLNQAQCRQILRDQLTMAEPSHYRNGVTLDTSHSALEVGAVSRLLNGKVRVRESEEPLMGESSGGE